MSILSNFKSRITFNNNLFFYFFWISFTLYVFQLSFLIISIISELIPTTFISLLEYKLYNVSLVGRSDMFRLWTISGISIFTFSNSTFIGLCD